MKKILTAAAALVIFLAGIYVPAYAEGGTIQIILQGLLGAGTGAAATAITGSKGDAVWQGALIGMGVNVVGGALLDIISGPSGTGGGTAVTYYNAPQPVVYQSPVVRQSVRPKPRVSAARRVYRAGYRNGYRQGYYDGYDDAMYDMGM